MTYLAKILFFTILSALFFISCQEDNKEIEVDPAFQIYLDRYVVAAQERGIDADFSDTGLSIQFGQLSEGVAGNCADRGSMTEGSHDITINKMEWDTMSDSQKERLILHEIGHCELGRIHDNQVYSNQDWKSIMRGDPLPLKSPLVNYFGVRKNYYIDELFNPQITAPDWVSLFASYDDISDNQRNMVLSVDQPTLDTHYNLSLSAEDDFEIECMLHKKSSGDNFYAGVRWGGSTDANSLAVLLRGTSSLDITSGENMIGPIFNYDLIEGEANAPAKLTLRKMDGMYYVFLNEEFLYWFEEVAFRSNMVSVDKEEDTDVDFYDLKVYTIK